MERRSLYFKAPKMLGVQIYGRAEEIEEKEEKENWREAELRLKKIESKGRRGGGFALVCWLTERAF